MARKRRSTPHDPPREAMEKQREARRHGSVRRPVVSDPDTNDIAPPKPAKPEPSNQDTATPAEPTPVPAIRPPGVIRRRPPIDDSEEQAASAPSALFPEESESDAPNQLRNA